MTICLGVKTTEGIVALADTQVVRGSERLKKAKLTTLDGLDGSAFIMTSGLRSVRDKSVIYLEERVATMGDSFTRLYQLVDEFGTQLRRVRAQDEPSLKEGNLRFDLHGIIGGRLSGDRTSSMFYVYPEGNWIEATFDSPYFTCGRTAYGKPILDRLLKGDTDIESALSLAYLAFDATRASVTDVDYPVDLLVCSSSGSIYTHRFSQADLADTHLWWSEKLAESLDAIPKGWLDPLTSKLKD